MCLCVYNRKQDAETEVLMLKKQEIGMSLQFQKIEKLEKQMKGKVEGDDLYDLYKKKLEILLHDL